jgi:hypothetical protein
MEWISIEEKLPDNGKKVKYRFSALFSADF